ncbi:hypothetical protein BDQ12DRAFT_608820 [Crucibulum laeve]|uniref:F-box domain-containing protein n=1 Tax=Crucibulum laeve TaxID=68775 RepID=A0A5C3LXP6_9AGAR|nr:hypothetical protein BDQ12DRAFT_608820 [Crucibulum laeve]
MFPIILRDPEATRKLLEAILDSPNGKRSLSRLARTCRAFSEPALDILWRDLDSLVPIIGLFPNNLLKKARRPGLGLAKTPREEDWNVIIRYSERIHRLTYDETSNNVAASIFPILEEHRPRTYILPRLEELTWKVETPAGLDRCALFLNPDLRVINLEIGTKFSQLNHFLADMSSRTKLTGFSFISPTSLPDAFTELLLRQDALEKVVLVAPGALSPGVGRWSASLPRLKQLQLDLTGRSMIAVEGFFDELRPRSGDSTPSSVGSTDSGVFSGEELDFSDIRKSALRLTGDLSSKGSFTQLRRLHLTGDVSNIAVFVKHLECPLTQLDLVIEDPPDNADWQDLCGLMCERFGESLQSLRITATNSSKFMDLVRSTSRAEPASSRLSLEHLTSLSSLTRLDIDLPESVIFTAADIESLAKACPNLEIVRLCPLARFPQNLGPPKISLEDLAPLMRNCKYLHTLSIAFHAKQGTAEILKERSASSPSLLRLHVGHSWINEPLQVSVLLSHLTPRLETVKWFQEKNRPGFIEANANSWQMVSNTLPHLQLMRAIERSFAQTPPVVRPETSEKAVDATVKTMERGVFAKVQMMDFGIQWSPSLIDRAVDAIPKTTTASIDATPQTRSAGIDATPRTVSAAVDARVFTQSKSIETAPPSPVSILGHSTKKQSSVYVLPSIIGIFSLAYRLFIAYPLSIPSQILGMAMARLPNWKGVQGESYKREPSGSPSAALNGDVVPLENLQVRQ